MSTDDEIDLEIDIHFSGRPQRATKMVCRKETTCCHTCVYPNMNKGAEEYNCPIDDIIFMTLDKSTFYCSYHKEYQ